MQGSSDAYGNFNSRCGHACVYHEGKLISCIGFFNEADTLESSSILIYSELRAGLYSQWIGLDAISVKR